MAQRTIYCELVSEQQLEQTVTLEGWVQKRRDLEGVVLIDLRDHEGIVQIIFNPEVNKEAWKIADRCRSEYVIEVTGEVRGRGEDAVNPRMAIGEFEVIASEIVILDQAKTPPFQIEDDQTTSDKIRLKYYYLDLCRPKMIKNIELRNVTTKAVCHYLDDNDFLDTETPYLRKSTPEDARNYLVPSRVRARHFCVLLQSPRLFRQLLMDARFDRYYQIVRCFRDEDLRGGRQPESTQVDIGTTFLTAEEI